MSTPYLSISKTFWRAEIRRDGKIVAALKGRHNNQEALDKFLKENWPHKQMWQNIPESYHPLTITIWKYIGVNGKVWATWIAADPSLSDNKPTSKE